MTLHIINSPGFFDCQMFTAYFTYLALMQVDNVGRNLVKYVKKFFLSDDGKRAEKTFLRLNLQAKHILHSVEISEFFLLFLLLKILMSKFRCDRIDHNIIFQIPNLLKVNFT